MKTSIQEIASRVSSYDALFKVQIASADSIGSDEVRISKARAKELHRELVILKKSLEQKTPSYYRRLDNIFSEEKFVLSQAIKKITA